AHRDRAGCIEQTATLLGEHSGALAQVRAVLLLSPADAKLSRCVSQSWSLSSLLFAGAAATLTRPTLARGCTSRVPTALPCTNRPGTFTSAPTEPTSGTSTTG